MYSVQYGQSLSENKKFLPTPIYQIKEDDLKLFTDGLRKN